MANEEHYVNTVGKALAIPANAVTTLMALLSRYGHVDGELIKHLRDGGELNFDIHIPRKMLNEFEDACAKQKIKYHIMDQNSQSEYVTICYKGASSFEKNNMGDYKKSDGIRIAQGSDFKTMHEIEDQINKEYAIRSAKDYVRIGGFEEGREVREINGLTRTEASILCEQLNANWVENSVSYNEALDSYSVAVPAESMERSARNSFRLSPGEKAFREMSFLVADKRVTDYIEDQANTNMAVTDLINSKDIKELYICEPMNLNPRDSINGRDFRTATIAIKNNIAEVYIKDTLNGIEIDEMLNITKENDRLRLFKDLSMMDGKSIYTKEEFDAMNAKHDQIVKFYDNEKNRDLIDLTLNPNRLEALRKENEMFEKIINERYGQSIEAFKADHLNHEGIERYEKNVLRIKAAETAINSCFTNEDIAFSEYKKARTLDPRIAESIEERKLGFLDPALRHKNATMKESRIENSNIIINHVATFTDEDLKKNISQQDREVFEQMKEKMDLRFNDTKIVLGERKISAGDLNSYGIGINIVSASAQEFAEYCEAYEKNGLADEYERPIDIEPGFSLNHPTAEELEEIDEDLTFSDDDISNHDIDGDGDFDEGDWDSFGNDKANLDDVGVLDSDYNPMDFDEEDRDLFV